MEIFSSCDLLDTINSATQCSGMLPPSAIKVMLPPSVQSSIYAEGVGYLGCGSISTMPGSSSGE